MLAHITGVLNPAGTFARIVPKLLDEKMHIQQDEMFHSQGNGDWAALSDWRVRDRGSSAPILDATGAFRSTVNEYVGMWSATESAFTYIYPGMFQQDAGQYFGITAGQRVNPLAKKAKRGQASSPKPMKTVPRPILFGNDRLRIDLDSVLRTFLADAGFIGAGITGFGGEQL